MGDIVQVLIIIGIIIFAIVKQIAGNSEEGKKQRPKMNIPQEDEEMEDMEYERTSPPPFLTHEYDLYSTPSNTTEHRPSRKQTHKTEIPPPPPIQEEPGGNQEFNIQSAEEVRRGIIWSEILNRKY